MKTNFEGELPADSPELQRRATEALVELYRKERSEEREKRRQVEKENLFLKSIIVMQHKQLNTDRMTGLANEQGVEGFVERKKTENLVIIFFDIDRFKGVNDNFGHEGGDVIIRAVGEDLKKRFRSEDEVIQLVDDEDMADLTVGRPHGDEFIVVCANTTEEDILKKIQNEEISLSVDYEGRTIPVTVSAGVTTYIPGETLKEGKERADKNMYIMKRAHHAGTNE